MPTIPIPQQGQLAADFTGPRQRGGGVRVDRSELQNAYSTLKQATGTGVRIPLVDVSSGLQNLGQGISNVGNQMLKVQEHNQQLTNTRRMADAQTAWEVSQDELKVRLSDPKIDPNEYGKLAEEHNRIFLETVNTEGMTDDAKQHLMDNWFKTQVSKSNTTATLNGVMENERRSRDSLNARGDYAERNYEPRGFVEAEKEKERLGLQTTEETANNIDRRAQNTNAKLYDEINTKVLTAIKDGNIGQAEAELMQHPKKEMLYPQQFGHIESVVKAAKAKAMTDDMIAVNPNQFLEDVIKAQNGDESANPALKGIEPAQLKDLEDRARQRIQENDNQAAYDAVNDIEYDVIKSPADLIKPRYNKMSAKSKAFVSGLLEKRKIEGMKFNPEDWMKFAVGIIPNIEVGTPQGKLDAATVKNAIGVLFPTSAGMENQRKALEDILDRHMSGAPADEFSQAEKILLDGFKAGGFGVTEVPYDPGKTPGIMDTIMYGLTLGPITGDTSRLQPKPGTALTPEDQARLNQPDKIAGEKNAMKLRPGQKVVDQRAYADAQKMLFDAQTHLDEMRKQGKTGKEGLDFARSALRVSALRGIVKPQTTPVPAAQKLQKVTDLLNNLPEPNNTLFPN